MERLGTRLAGCLLARLSSSNLGCHRPAIKFDDFNSTHKLNISLPSKFRRKNSTIKCDGLNSTYKQAIDRLQQVSGGFGCVEQYAFLIKLFVFSRHDKNVLFLFFEYMKDDLEGAVREVASFIGVKDEERIKKAVEMSSFEYMKGHSDQFSCREAQYNREALGLSNDAQIKLLVKGSVTEGKEMMEDETKAAIQARWLEVVGKQTGLEDYDELRSTFKKEKKNRI